MSSSSTYTDRSTSRIPSATVVIPNVPTASVPASICRRCDADHRAIDAERQRASRPQSGRGDKIDRRWRLVPRPGPARAEHPLIAARAINISTPPCPTAKPRPRVNSACTRRAP
jgi:hypothetical protein